VDSDGWVGVWPSLALDATGRPHISYFGEDYDFKYARWTGSTWEIQTVDSAGPAGVYTSLALNAAGYPHISYCDFGHNLKYAYWTGSTWSIQTVDSGPDVGQHTSLALDAAGHPHISYDDWSNGALKYARWMGDTWDIQTVDSARVERYFTSLALDAVGHPHISYCFYDDNSTAFKYAHWTGSTWNIQIVDSEGWVGKYTSLTLDAAGHPHISYDDWSNYNLKYARWTGDTWDIQTVDNGISYGGLYASLALDAAGQPHISYYDAVSGDLKYAWWTGSTWDIQTVDSEGDVGMYTSLALDDAGYPHISYHDSHNGYLKYARLNLALHKQVTHGTDINHLGILTYTLHFAGRHVTLNDPLPDTVRYVSDSLTSTLPSPVVYSPTLHAVLWAGRLPTDTRQQVQFQVAPVPGPVLLHPVVNTAYLTNTESGRVISATASVNVALPPLVLHKHVTPRDSVRNGDVMTYTLVFDGPGLDVRLWDPLPDLVRYVPGSLTSTLSPTAVYSPTTHAVLWAGTLPLSAASQISFQVIPDMTGTLTLQLAPTIVNTAWLTDMVYGRHVSATAIVNGLRLYLPIILQVG